MPSAARPGWARGLTAATDSRVARMAAGKTGKSNWARGLTAATSESIARNAALRRGRARGSYPTRVASRVARRLYPNGHVEWTQQLAYAVGLIATDGCLSGKTITFTNTDRDLVKTFVECVGHSVKIGVQHKFGRQPAYRAQMGNRTLFDWLVAIGITPRKSLTIGAISVPDTYFLAVVRGLLDGDGSVRNYWYTVPKGTRPYQALAVLFHSASRPHLEWLQHELTRQHGFRGALFRKGQRPHDVHALKYSTKEARRLLPLLYPPGVPCLQRKLLIWEAYRGRECG